MRKWLFLLLFIIGTACAEARTIKDFLVRMPVVVQNVISHANLLDCVDFMESGMKASVKNYFGEVTTLTALSDSYARLEISPVSSMEFKLLPRQKDSLICVIHTYQLLSASESELHVYNSEWREILLNTIIKMPTMGQFAKKDVSKIERQHASEAFHPAFIMAYLSGESNDLTFQLNAQSNNEELMKEMESLLRDGLVYKWNGKKYKEGAD